MALRGWSILLGVGALCACSSKPKGTTGFAVVDTGGTSGSAGDQTALFGSGGADGAGAGNGTGANGTGTGGLNAATQCTGTAFEAEPEPVDMYIMFDHSDSMADPIPGTNPPVTWWATAQNAVTSFVNSQQAAQAQMGVGIQFFPLDGTAPTSCTADYSTPAVEIANLPGNASAVAAAIQKEEPGDFTPTGVALQGALDHMKTWGPAHPGRAPVVVFVTDGFPTECAPGDLSEGEEIPDVATRAKTAFEGTPSIRTFVVGFNLGAGGTNLDQIAKAGGTTKATLIDNGDIGQQFIDAMLGIASTPLQCDFDIPKPTPPQVLDFTLIDVKYTPIATGVAQEVPLVGNLGNCTLNNNQGWYYDNPPPATPQKILMCPGTCDQFAAGSVAIALGCQPTTILN